MLRHLAITRPGVKGYQSPVSRVSRCAARARTRYPESSIPCAFRFPENFEDWITASSLKARFPVCESMKRLAAILFLVALMAQCSAAQSRSAKISHYVKTHKRLLVADAIIMAAWSADAASSVHAQKSGCCVESNPLVGKHPNELVTWVYGMGVGSAMITGEHLIWWAGNKYGDPEAAHVLIWPGPIAFGIGEFFNVRDNAKYAGMAEARARLMSQ